MKVDWIQERELRCLATAKASPELSDAQRASIERVDGLHVMKGSRAATRLRFALKAKKLGVFLGKPFEDATRDDIARFLTLVAETYEPESVRFVGSFVRRFYAMLLSPYDEKVPDIVSWIRTSKPRASHRRPKHIFKPEEVKRLLESAKRPRDRAFIAILYESGARISEICGLSVGDVAFDKYGARIVVDGKTGVRRVRLIQSAPDLGSWLNVHPWRTQPDSPLFVRETNDSIPLPILQGNARQILNLAAKRAGIDKKPNPHAFRRSRATELSQRLTPSELSVYHGWVQGSAMPQVYIHLAGDDVEQKLLQQAGILTLNEATSNPLSLRACPRCKENNSAVAEFCSRCALLLDEEKARKAALDDESFRKRTERLLDILENPEVALLLAKKVNADRESSRCG